VFAYAVTWIGDRVELGVAVYATLFHAVGSFLGWFCLVIMLDKRFWDMLDVFSSSVRIPLTVLIQILNPLLSTVFIEGRVSGRLSWSWWVVSIPLLVYLSFWSCLTSVLFYRSLSSSSSESDNKKEENEYEMMAA
jgi:hypothetical protein